jgi:hypothetical protein
MPDDNNKTAKYGNSYLYDHCLYVYIIRVWLDSLIKTDQWIAHNIIVIFIIWEV